MKVNRSELEQVLLQKFEDIKSDSKFTEELKGELAKYNVLAGDVQKIISHFTPIGEVDDTLLYLITNAIHSLTTENRFNPETYFNEREIQVASRHKEFLDERVKLPITIENVVYLNDQEYITAIPIKTLVEWDNSQLIEYNPETQRNPKERMKRGKIVTLANVNKQSVKEIVEHILNKTFRADTVILNILADGRDEIRYDEKHARLTIKSGEIDILDGFHRLNAFSQVINLLNPDEDLKVQVAIKNFSVKEAQAYVAQINTVNKMPSTYIQKLRADRYSDIIAKELQKESELKNRVSPTHLLNHAVGHLLSYKLLTEEIDEQFKINSKIEALNLANYLIVFFDYLIGSFPQEFAKDKSGTTVLSKHFMFIGYLTLAKHMFENEVPARSVADVISKINLDENSPFIQEVKNMNVPISNKKLKKFVRDYFSKIPLEGSLKGV